MKYQQYLVLALIFVCLIGCKKIDPRKAGLVPAGGTITYNGSPLDGATIVFVPKESNKQGAGALSGADGTFTLTTISDNDGAFPVEYSVYVLKEEPLQISDEELMEYSRQGKTPPKPKSLIPIKYTNPTKPMLNFTIPVAGDKNLLIKLKD
ncbi:MAG: carboxypeptidase-like regulatory domain-containing protein [Planctomycetaceae bacterium]|jgi:hypothetical protein|nr:carboxypeptidase-like regulatory domain-containing protein [Planctomycetaceae bacterium]